MTKTFGARLCAGLYGLYCAALLAALAEALLRGPDSLFVSLLCKLSVG